MQIHELTAPAHAKRKRVGRGGKRGTYSGRGVKGQKSRSGGNVDPLFEGGRSSLVERMKKTRGVKAFNHEKTTVTLAMLEMNYEDGETVSLETLLEKKILTKKIKSRGVKVVASGKITKKLTIAGEIGLSQGAHDAITKAGGTVEEVAS